MVSKKTNKKQQPIKQPKKNTLSDKAAKEVNKSDKEVIFLDLDGTLVDSIGGALRSINSNCIPYEYNVNKWEIPEKDKEYVIWTFTNLAFLAKVSVFPWAKTLVSVLSEEYELVIITARPEVTHELTKNYCYYHFPEVKHILFATKEEPKHIIINKFRNAKALVEDCPKYMMEVVDNCILSGKSKLTHVIAVDVCNQPYTVLDWKDELGNHTSLSNTDYKSYVIVENLYRIAYLLLHHSI